MRTFVFVFLGLLATACGGEVVEQAPVPRPVKMLDLGSGGMTGIVEMPGSVSPAQNAEMAFEVGGRIISFPVNESQWVNKGAVLARLDPQDYAARRDREVASRNAARADYERYQELYASDATSLQDLELKRREFEVAEANARTAQKAFGDTYLRAPFEGRVARKLVDDFQTVGAGQTILLLQDDSSLEINIDVPEGTLAEAAVEGRKIDLEVEVSAHPGRRFPAQIKEIATAADPVTRTFEATLAFDAPDDLTILPGMTARVIVSIETMAGEAGFTIPASAVLSDESGAASVWKVDTGSMEVHQSPVVLGVMSGSTVIVTEGLSLGDRVAVSGVHNLREGMLVRPLED